jgi:hypothetical protein
MAILFRRVAALLTLDVVGAEKSHSSRQQRLADNTASARAHELHSANVITRRLFSSGQKSS